MSGSLPRGRRAIRRIIMPAVVIITVVVLGSLGLLLYAAAAVDSAQAREEHALVARKIDRTLTSTVTEITSASIWDDAYLNLVRSFDTSWADINIGNYYAQYMDHDVTVLLDDRNRPIYAWRGETRVAPESEAAFTRDALPLVLKIRARERQRPVASKAPPLVAFEALLTASGVVKSGGAVYLTGASTIVPETTEVTQLNRPTVIVLSAKRMDRGFLVSLKDDLRIQDAAIAGGAADARGSSTLPIIDVHGRTIGALNWRPKRPGLENLRDAAPLFGMGLLVLVLAGGALAARIREVFRDLAANDARLSQTMAELVGARDLAQSANIAKSAFLANMSHEIRTPLNGVLGMAQVMGRGPLDPAQRDRLNIIRDSGETLLTVLNDILDISKIEAGRLEIDNHEFDLAEGVRAASKPFASLAAQKDVDFTIEIAASAQGVWFGDGVRLRQVIANLASNAVKFTHAGRITVQVEADGSAVRFEVRDTGIGIPVERHADLFEKFSQVDTSTTRRFGGTGLGLAISRELVELMGGTLSLTSVEGEGSAFAFTLPLERRAAAAQPTARWEDDAADFDGRAARVLAAEDNPTNQLILKALLEPLGVELTLASDGLEALQAFATGGFDLVLMDVQMPVMNGVEATTAIRVLEAERGLTPTPILALSANVMNHQVQEYLAAGMTGFIPKPLNAGELAEAVRAAVSPGEMPDVNAAAA